MGSLILILYIRMAMPILWTYLIWFLYSDGCVHAEDPFTWSFSCWITAPIPWIHVFFIRDFSYVYVSMLDLQVSWQQRLVPCTYLQSISPLTHVRTSYFRGHLLQSNSSLSLYSPFLDPGGPIQWPLCTFQAWNTYPWATLCLPIHLPLQLF